MGPRYLEASKGDCGTPRLFLLLSFLLLDYPRVFMLHYMCLPDKLLCDRLKNNGTNKLIMDRLSSKL